MLFPLLVTLHALAATVWTGGHLVVLAIGVLPRALREAHRILKPCGSILIGMIDPVSTLVRQYEARKATSTFYDPAHFHAVEQVIAWLREWGFTRVRCRQAVLPGFGAGAFIAVRAQA